MVRRCFVDPLFSTGIHLSTYSALLAARSIYYRLVAATHGYWRCSPCEVTNHRDRLESLA
jgi:hypothetical protein